MVLIRRQLVYSQLMGSYLSTLPSCVWDETHISTGYKRYTDRNKPCRVNLLEIAAKSYLNSKQEGHRNNVILDNSKDKLIIAEMPLLRALPIQV